MTAKRKFEKKDLYSAEDLLHHKLSYEERNAKLINSLCDIMFRTVGKDFYWAREHDKEDLHIIDLIYMTKDQYDNFETLVKKILKKQLSCTTQQAENEIAWFLFSMGLSYISDEQEYTSSEKIKSSVRNKIENYEEKHGELTYSDGWEVELKKWLNE